MWEMLHIKTVLDSCIFIAVSIIICLLLPQSFFLSSLSNIKHLTLCPPCVIYIYIYIYTHINVNIKA